MIESTTFAMMRPLIDFPKADRIERNAEISDDGTYRYRLTRRFPAETLTGRGLLGFGMLNPSTADGLVDDATIRRDMRFAWIWGYDGIWVWNLYGMRATRPTRLWDLSVWDPIGPLNDTHILGAVGNCAATIAAWGAEPRAAMRGDSVARKLTGLGGRLFHLGLTKGGHPRHPLYVPYSVTPQPWER